MKTVLKALKILICLAVVILGLLAAARWYAVRELDGADGSRAGLLTAVSKLESDRRIVYSRVAEISNASYRSKQSTADEVAELLGDGDLNRLALRYMGADWSIPRSVFLGRVRELQNRQNQAKKLADARYSRIMRCKRMLEMLESRKRHIGMYLNSPSILKMARRELSDVESRIAEVQATEEYRELVGLKTGNEKSVQEMLSLDDEISHLAEEWRRDSVERLDGVIGAQLVECQESLLRLERRQAVLSWLDFEPLSTLIPRRMAR